MRPLTSRGPRLAVLACAAALAAPCASASPTGCNYPSSSTDTSPSNVFAYQGHLCSVNVLSVTATSSLPKPDDVTSISLPPGVSYTGFALFAYHSPSAAGSGGSVTAQNAVSITSAPNLTNAFGVYSLGATANVTFSSTASVMTTGPQAFGLYASGGTISTSGWTTITTSGAGAGGVVADNRGIVTLSGGASITTGASGSAGAQAENGGVIVITGAAPRLEAGTPPGVTTNASNSPGLTASGAGSTVTTEVSDSGSVGVPITTSGINSPGARADTGGAVTLNGGSVTTSGSGSQGLYAVGVVNGSGAASTISANGVAIATVGSPGIEATGVGAQVSTGALPGVGPTTVTTTDAVGVQADTGGAVTLNGGSVTTSGAGAVGVAATTGGRAALDGVTVTTSGEAAHALAVSGSGSQASVGGGAAFGTQGAGAIGLYASQGGAITSSGTTSVTTTGGVSPATGLGAHGVNADGAGSTVDLASATIRTAGANAFGLLASDANGSGAAGSITAGGFLTVTTINPAATAIGLQGNGASIVATGGGTITSAGGAIAFLGGTNQTATFDNFTIANQSGDLIFADPSVATVNFNGTTANAGANNLLDATAGSIVTLNASRSALTGAIQTDAASTSTVNLTGGSTWTMTGSSVVSNLAVANSFVIFAPPGAGQGFKTLTLNNYVGSAGYITMNATLGGTGSQSDQIVINGGRATGQTLLTIRNVGGIGAQTSGAGIPVIVAVNGGTIARNAFALANSPVVGGYRYTLDQNGQDLYLVSAPTTTLAQLASSATSIAKAQQQAIITGRVLSSILLGATEQVSCSNCSSGFGSIGSFALGAHGRTSLSPELTAMGGFSYNEYSADGIRVTNAPTFAGSLVYDPTNFGGSRPFVEVGGGVVPFEQVRYTRTYPYGPYIAQGQANAVNRSLGLFGRVGWVDRVTPIDEAAIYTDFSRSWMVAGGYTEASAGNNPYPATVSTGLAALDVLRFGGQYTHLFNGQFETNVSGAVAYGFSETNSSQWNVADYGLVAPYPVGNSVWYEWGARVGYRFGQRIVIDAFLLGTLGGQIGTTVHGGVGVRYLF